MFNPNLSYVFWRFSLGTNTTTPDLSKQNPSLSHGCHANRQTGLSRIFLFFYTYIQAHIYKYICTIGIYNAYECVIIGYCLPVSSTWIVCVSMCACVWVYTIYAPTVFYTLFNPNIYLTNLITTIVAAASEWI